MEIVSIVIAAVSCDGRGSLPGLPGLCFDSSLRASACVRGRSCAGSLNILTAGHGNRDQDCA